MSMEPSEMDGQFKKAVAAVKNLNIQYLQELQTEISDEIEKQRKSAVRDAAAEVVKIAARLGMKPEDLIRIAKTAKAGPATNPAPIKYQHPDKPELHWTGRGRSPKWVKEWADAHNGNLDAVAV